MTIFITPDKTLKEIQSEFSKHFSYLKLEFFSRPQAAGKATKKEYMQNNALHVKEVTKSKTDGVIDIHNETVVRELEKNFREDFGLNVQVFRKSGKIWLETTATDNWTLAYQNSQGQELDKANLSNDKEENDYHEQL